MGKHTPGPWRFEIPWAGFSAIRGPENQLIFGVAAGDDDERRPEPEIEANARLISAAPDLLEALELLTTERERQLQNRIKGSKNAYGEMPHEIDREAVRMMTAQVDQARAAIAKAKGESE